MPAPTPSSHRNGAARRIVVYDTTLRDGAQGPAVSFSAADKIRIARALDAGQLTRLLTPAVQALLDTAPRQA